MANPEVMKRLEEIEARAEESPVAMLRGDVHELLGMTRALLESQGELIEAAHFARVNNLRDHPSNVEEEAYYVGVIARAEAVRRGEGL